jgi:hypothetical protein
MLRTLGVITSQAGVPYQFLSWSDGGAATHTITTPTTNSTYTATYLEPPPLAPPQNPRIVYPQ